MSNNGGRVLTDKTPQLIKYVSVAVLAILAVVFGWNGLTSKSELRHLLEKTVELVDEVGTVDKSRPSPPAEGAIAYDTQTVIASELRVPPPQGTNPPDFRDAKNLLRALHEKYPFEVYCGCQFSRGRDIDANCGLRTNKFANRSDRIEWEHVVPASDFGRQMPCWREAPGKTSGRKWCERTDDRFRRMEGDPYNLLPAIGSLNAIRSNHRYGEVPGEKRQFGSCDFEIEDRIVEPPDFIKGDVARIYFYFEDRYNHRISSSQRKLFLAWHAQDPIDDYERMRAQDVEAYVGWKNPYALGIKIPGTR